VNTFEVFGSLDENFTDFFRIGFQRLFRIADTTTRSGVAPSTNGNLTGTAMHSDADAPQC
jgi:hypothetical protein